MTNISISSENVRRQLRAMGFGFDVENIPTTCPPVARTNPHTDYDCPNFRATYPIPGTGYAYRYDSDAQLVDVIRPGGIVVWRRGHSAAAPQATREEQIVEAVRAFDGRRTKRGYPYLRDLRSHAGIPDITAQERDKAAQSVGV